MIEPDADSPPKPIHRPGRDCDHRIALVGLPGAGKTTVGRLLAEELGWQFFDCDTIFETETGMRISAWAAARGWAAFRAREYSILAAALAREPIVIATGGGAVEDEKKRAALTAAATVIWLRVPLGRLAARLDETHDRPLLAEAPDKQLAELAARREPLYAEVAAITLAVTDESPNDVAARLLDELHRMQRCL